MQGSVPATFCTICKTTLGVPKLKESMLIMCHNKNVLDKKCLVRYINNSCDLSTATIGYSSACVCVSVCVRWRLSVCVSVSKITSKIFNLGI